MKKLNKNVSGMTLVEVVIAMGMFSIAVLGVCMAFSAALRMTARNMRRDNELTVQQTAIERNSTAGVMLNDGSTLDAMTINFKNGANVTSVTGVSEYKAIKSAANGEDFNFEIKSLSSTPLGGIATVADKSNNEYQIYVENKSTDSADVSISIVAGEIYEGSRTSGYCYKHSSPTYLRTLAAQGSDAASTSQMPDRFLIGYYYAGNLSTETNTILSFKITCGTKTYYYDFSNAQMAAASNGKLSLEITSSGVSATYS
jgi:Tfp pilus assembly protein PilV